MWNRRYAGLIILILMLGFGTLQAQTTEIVVGGQCDRTGPTKLIGTQLCPGVLDYIKLVNKQGGVAGHPLKWIEVEHAYKVDRGVEAYERVKREGGVAILDYGTPIVYALTPRHMEDKIPGLTPGFGRADATDGERFTYIFPMAATYWSQMGAALQYIKDQGTKAGSKIAYLYYDNPAGREPLPIWETICKLEKYECRTFAVPPPGVEMASAVLDITRRMRADYVVSHLFGKAPSISIKELKKNGYPLNKVISFVWGAGEHDMVAAGWKTAQGYLGLQFAGVGRDFKVIEDIMQIYKDEGKEVPATVGSVYYNRGVFAAAVIAESVRLAVKNHGMPLTGEKVRMGMEQLKEYDLDGFLPPLNVTPQDHEGGGWVRLYRTEGETLVPHTDWFKGYREVVLKQVKASASQ